MQVRDKLREAEPGGLLQTPHPGALLLLQPQPSPRAQSRPAQVCEPGDRGGQHQAGSSDVHRALFLTEYLELQL